ncbi:uncharacterized protein TRUGW13939_05109 [Talaromyces rugulosus]|uniref:Uncharacterized protein n=1 Tax=Talaromyces rugulosus TaxID=121627 RepID=A0A7H8QVH7_TALRU|nr:uncharacterized protein TRUGW13939_05109 [Talaromyces rugulosus]QKX57989.1 hypothetical protein TRUGW13939_05109 [Talaromyces rugulosus]
MLQHQSEYTWMSFMISFRMLQPQIFQLSVVAAFDALTSSEKLYAHHMSRAAWAGTRIILRQVSPEANGIFDLIIALHHACDGQWEALSQRTGVGMPDIDRFLDYAATFLSNVGNYIGSGDQKFIPDISPESLTRLAAVSPSATQLLDGIKVQLYQQLPNCLGVPNGLAQSAYYLGNDCLKSPEDTSAILSAMEKKGVFPENTRLRKSTPPDGITVYDLLQASVQQDESDLDILAADKKLRLIRGDHKQELEKICASLLSASQNVANPAQNQLLTELHDSFLNGDLNTYRSSQRIWVKDKAPRVETVLGFVEPYRDPLGVRAEFEGIVGIADTKETFVLRKLAEMGSRLIP